eukprot:GHVU01068344.1.p1 GENE.GHVU01068344.1~~GHVU01068344.1.p1  ORF type:complete len:431 (-),score=46.01 GHVU01068344.1:159-1451(-)
MANSQDSYKFNSTTSALSSKSSGAAGFEEENGKRNKWRIALFVIGALVVCLLIAVIVIIYLASSTTTNVAPTKEDNMSQNESRVTIDEDVFGKTSDGQTIKRFTMKNKNQMEVEVITYGGAIRSIKVPDKHGNIADVALACDNMAEYESPSNMNFGGLIGRHANRIHNGQFEIGGKSYQLPTNDGSNHLHGGPRGWDKHVWDGKKEGDDVVMSRTSPDGEQGYPGTVKVKVTFTLTDDNTLALNFTADVTGSPTPINLCTHPYFNLAGQGSGAVFDHRFTINADSYTPTDADLIPTGEIKDVTSTVFDLREPTRLGDVIKNVTVKGDGYDSNFCVRGPTGKRFAARISEPTTGRVLEVYSNQPGVQLYTGNFLDQTPGKGGKLYPKYGGFCVETQNYPDSVNQPNFPDSVLRPGSTYIHTAWYKFLTDND